MATKGIDRGGVSGNIEELEALRRRISFFSPHISPGAYVFVLAAWHVPVFLFRIGASVFGKTKMYIFPMILDNCSWRDCVSLRSGYIV